MKAAKFLALAALTLLAVLGLAQAAPTKGVLEKITNEDAESFPKVAQSRPVKFVLFPGAQGKWARLVVIDPRVFTFHHEYLSTLPEFKGLGYKEIEPLTYRKANRKALLGSLRDDTKVLGRGGEPQSIVSFQLSTEEAPDATTAALVQKILSAWLEKNAPDTRFSEKLNFMPMGHQEKEMFERAETYRIAGITLLSIASTGRHQAYSTAWNVGRVFVAAKAADVEAGIKSGKITQETLLVTGAELRELPPVAGVISSIRLTEASHLVLLGQMYSIPILFEKGAVETYSRLSGKMLFLSTNLNQPGDPTIFDRLLPEDVVRLEKARHRPALKIEFDASPIAIRPVKELQPHDVSAYGGKATKFGLLQREIAGNTRDRVVGIPLSRYLAFLQQATLPIGSTLSKQIENALGGMGANPTYIQVQETTAKIRQLFQDAKAPTGFFEAIRAELRAQFPGEKVRLKLRSSSNVEDGAEFNGAGLYESEGVCLTGCEKDDFAKGLLKVWASLYTTRGFWARQQFGVPETRVGMGVLAHAPFKGELANGVVKFSAGEGRCEASTQVITVEGEHDSVTNAAGESKAEVAQLCNDSIDEVKEAAGKAKGRTLMRPAHYQTLAALMKKLFASWPDRVAGQEIEAEWKLMGEAGQEKIYIKQVRAIPRPTGFHLEDGSKLFFLTGGRMELRPNWPLGGDLLARALQRVEVVELDLPSFTDLDITRGLLEPRNAVLTINGKKIPAQVKFLERNQTGIVIRLENPVHKNLVLLIELPKLTDRLQIEAISRPSNYSASLYYDGSKTDDGYWIGPSVDVRDVSQADALWDTEKKSRTISFKKDKCPFQFQGTSALAVFITDNELRTFERAELKGLASKPLTFSGSTQVLYHQQLHEGTEYLAIDLSQAKGVQPAELNALISKYGRYLAWEQGNIWFLDEQYERRDAPEACRSSREN